MNTLRKIILIQGYLTIVCELAIATEIFIRYRLHSIIGIALLALSLSSAFIAVVIVIAIHKSKQS